MGIFDNTRERLSAFIAPPPPIAAEKPRPTANYHYEGYSSGVVWSKSYNGEKNSGELGPAILYHPDYEMLRIRSWQSWMESDITKTVIGRFITWAIGTGLKVQASPNLTVLNSEGFKDLDQAGRDEFTKVAEQRYAIWADSKYSTWAEVKSVHQDEKTAFKNTLIGGDVLVVLRYVKKQVTVQLIDGQNVQSALKYSETGNRIVHGVEIDSRGRHVAYHIKTAGGGINGERISARPKGSRPTMAFLVYGNEYRVDSVRGMPLIGTVMETLKKMERYKEATVGSAEERAKVPYQVVHGINSTGENPLQKRLAKAMDADSNELPADSAGKEVARLVAVTTSKDVFNMPQDSKLESLESKVELNFEGFYDANFNIICASLGIPPNVAKMLYNDNFSASRAALKDWENSLKVARKDFSDQFHSRIYEFWLWTEVMDGKIQAAGLLNALVEENRMAIDAYMKTRWVGAQVPHIDPEKEARAERLKLGPLGVNIPLTTAMEALENLSSDEADETFNRFAEELKMMDKLKLEPKVEEVKGTPPNNGGTPPKKKAGK